VILIIAGTDRKNSNTRKIANHVQALFTENGAETQLLDLAELQQSSMGGPYYGKAVGPDALVRAQELVLNADGIYVCVPEYNGSMPGALKYFIDHWKYPDAFEFRPFALCGLGTTWGGLRPVEHLQGVFGYRNAFIYPERVFLREIYKIMQDGALTDPFLLDLLRKQVQGFLAFVNALKAAGLDANSRRTTASPS
jgi:NAD(P)H-dependent FMN reductase